MADMGEIATEETGLVEDQVQVEVANGEAQAAAEPLLDQAKMENLAVAMEGYRRLLYQVAANKKALRECRQGLADLRQHIRTLSAQVQRDPRLEGDGDNHDLHTSKVAAQYDDCGNIINYAEQVRRHVYDNSGQAEELLNPMSQSMDLLRLRVRYIRLLETLLAAQETGIRLEIQQRNADACIWQLADIFKVREPA